MSPCGPRGGPRPSFHYAHGRRDDRTRHSLRRQARTTLANFFSPLVNHAEQMFLTGRSACPVERTSLTTGLVEAGVDSLHQEQARLETPHLDVAYPSPVESTFWRS